MRRFIFVPTRLDAMTGATRREMSLCSIHSVHILDPGVGAVKQRDIAASIRPQLEITDGTDSPLVVTVAALDGLARLLSH